MHCAHPLLHLSPLTPMVPSALPHPHPRHPSCPQPPDSPSVLPPPCPVLHASRPSVLSPPCTPTPVYKKCNSPSPCLITHTLPYHPHPASSPTPCLIAHTLPRHLHPAMSPTPCLITYTPAHHPHPACPSANILPYNMHRTPLSAPLPPLPHSSLTIPGLITHHPHAPISTLTGHDFSKLPPTPPHTLFPCVCTCRLQP